MSSTPVIGSKRGLLSFEDEFDVPQTPKKIKSVNPMMVTPESEDKREGNGSNSTCNSISNPFLTPKSPSALNASTPRRLVFGKESIYGKTKALLQRSCGIFTETDGSLVTRKEQFECISRFLDQSILQHKSDSLYITGPPGTGKTAQIDAIVRDRFSPIALGSKKKHAPGLVNTSFYGSPSSEQVESVAVSTINCIAINDPSTIFHKIYHSIAEKPEARSVKTMTDLQQFMESYSSTTTFCVVLDEMDKLVHSSLQDTNSTRMIFELFLLAKLPSIRLVLIGIANSLDMKDRFLSRLNLRQDLMPQTVVFQPYSADQMSDIVMKRLDSLPQCIFNPMAVKYAAKRCSGNTGDLRKLFDVLRSSVEVVELERIANMKTQKDQQLTKVNFQHVAKVFSQFMNHNSTKSRVHTLNMQQRTILCAIVHREKVDIFQTHCSLDDAYDYYVRFLKGKESLSPLRRNEFLEICNALETCGVVNIFQGKSHGKTKHTVRLIRSCVDERELEQEVGKFEILRKIIAF
ncbi:hypothetical protein ZYGR_0AI05200 [Zygosaccharomyces rouxii]|uniref:Cell division control protein n=1 Tax=Zygosaccharomyces rouxii TaxID=4956 RepID=A0A1Q3ABT4_ZYGRO|nr:hypothetical protein ZYGR_0AI05200 [Zygosaccharomyces rouxii]